MKIKKEIELDICDDCKEEEAYYTCLGCGKTFCFDCKERNGVEYAHAISLRGRGDGYFCNKCDKDPPKKVKELHDRYLEIKNMREDIKRFHEKSEIKYKILEKELRILYDKIKEEVE